MPSKTEPYQDKAKLKHKDSRLHAEPRQQHSQMKSPRHHAGKDGEGKHHSGKPDSGKHRESKHGDTKQKLHGEKIQPHDEVLTPRLPPPPPDPMGLQLDILLADKHIGAEWLYYSEDAFLRKIELANFLCNSEQRAKKMMRELLEHDYMRAWIENATKDGKYSRLAGLIQLDSGIDFHLALVSQHEYAKEKINEQRLEMLERLRVVVKTCCPDRALDGLEEVPNFVSRVAQEIPKLGLYGFKQLRDENTVNNTYPEYLFHIHLNERLNELLFLHTSNREWDIMYRKIVEIVAPNDPSLHLRGFSDGDATLALRRRTRSDQAQAVLKHLHVCLHHIQQIEADLAYMLEQMEDAVDLKLKTWLSHKLRNLGGILLQSIDQKDSDVKLLNLLLLCYKQEELLLSQARFFDKLTLKLEAKMTKHHLESAYRLIKYEKEIEKARFQRRIVTVLWHDIFDPTIDFENLDTELRNAVQTIMDTKRSNAEPIKIGEIEIQFDFFRDTIATCAKQVKKRLDLLFPNELIANTLVFMNENQVALPTNTSFEHVSYVLIEKFEVSNDRVLQHFEEANNVQRANVLRRHLRNMVTANKKKKPDSSNLRLATDITRSEKQKIILETRPTGFLKSAVSRALLVVAGHSKGRFKNLLKGPLATVKDLRSQQRSFFQFKANKSMYDTDLIDLKEKYKLDKEEDDSPESLAQKIASYPSPYQLGIKYLAFLDGEMQLFIKRAHVLLKKKLIEATYGSIKYVRQMVREIDGIVFSPEMAQLMPHSRKLTPPPHLKKITGAFTFNHFLQRIVTQLIECQKTIGVAGKFVMLHFKEKAESKLRDIKQRYDEREPNPEFELDMGKKQGNLDVMSARKKSAKRARMLEHWTKEKNHSRLVARISMAFSGSDANFIRSIAELDSKFANIQENALEKVGDTEWYQRIEAEEDLARNKNNAYRDGMHYAPRSGSSSASPSSPVACQLSIRASPVSPSEQQPSSGKGLLQLKDSPTGNHKQEAMADSRNVENDSTEKVSLEDSVLLSVDDSEEVANDYLEQPEENSHNSRNPNEYCCFYEEWSLDQTSTPSIPSIIGGVGKPEDRVEHHGGVRSIADRRPFKVKESESLQPGIEQIDTERADTELHEPYHLMLFEGSVMAPPKKASPKAKKASPKGAKIEKIEKPTPKAKKAAPKSKKAAPRNAAPQRETSQDDVSYDEVSQSEVSRSEGASPKPKTKFSKTGRFSPGKFSPKGVKGKGGKKASFKRKGEKSGKIGANAGGQASVGVLDVEALNGMDGAGFDSIELEDSPGANTEGEALLEDLAEGGSIVVKSVQGSRGLLEASGKFLAEAPEGSRRVGSQQLGSQRLSSQRAWSEQLGGEQVRESAAEKVPGDGKDEGLHEVGEADDGRKSTRLRGDGRRESIAREPQEQQPATEEKPPEENLHAAEVLVQLDNKRKSYKSLHRRPKFEETPYRDDAHVAWEKDQKVEFCGHKEANLAFRSLMYQDFREIAEQQQRIQYLQEELIHSGFKLANAMRQVWPGNYDLVFMEKWHEQRKIEFAGRPTARETRPGFSVSYVPPTEDQFATDYFEGSRSTTVGNMPVSMNAAGYGGNMPGSTIPAGYAGYLPVSVNTTGHLPGGHGRNMPGPYLNASTAGEASIGWNDAAPVATNPLDGQAYNPLNGQPRVWMDGTNSNPISSLSGNSVDRPESPNRAESYVTSSPGLRTIGATGSALNSGASPDSAQIEPGTMPGLLPGGQQVTMPGMGQADMMKNTMHVMNNATQGGGYAVYEVSNAMHPGMYDMNNTRHAHGSIKKDNQQDYQHFYPEFGSDDDDISKRNIPNRKGNRRSVNNEKKQSPYERKISESDAELLRKGGSFLWSQQQKDAWFAHKREGDESTEDEGQFGGFVTTSDENTDVTRRVKKMIGVGKSRFYFYNTAEETKELRQDMDSRQHAAWQQRGGGSQGKGSQGKASMKGTPKTKPIGGSGSGQSSASKKQENETPKKQDEESEQGASDSANVDDSFENRSLMSPSSQEGSSTGNGSNAAHDVGYNLNKASNALIPYNSNITLNVSHRHGPLLLPQNTFPHSSSDFPHLSGRSFQERAPTSDEDSDEMIRLEVSYTMEESPVRRPPSRDGNGILVRPTRIATSSKASTDQPVSMSSRPAVSPRDRAALLSDGRELKANADLNAGLDGYRASDGRSRRNPKRKVRFDTTDTEYFTTSASRSPRDYGDKRSPKNYMDKRIPRRDDARYSKRSPRHYAEDVGGRGRFDSRRSDHEKTLKSISPRANFSRTSDRGLFDHRHLASGSREPSRSRDEPVGSRERRTSTFVRENSRRGSKTSKSPASRLPPMIRADHSETAEGGRGTQKRRSEKRRPHRHPEDVLGPVLKSAKNINRARSGSSRTSGSSPRLRIVSESSVSPGNNIRQQRAARMNAEGAGRQMQRFFFYQESSSFQGSSSLQERSVDDGSGSLDRSEASSGSSSSSSATRHPPPSLRHLLVSPESVKIEKSEMKKENSTTRKEKSVDTEKSEKKRKDQKQVEKKDTEEKSSKSEKKMKKKQVEDKEDRYSYKDGKSPSPRGSPTGSARASSAGNLSDRSLLDSPPGESPVAIGNSSARYLENNLLEVPGSPKRPISPRGTGSELFFQNQGGSRPISNPGSATSKTSKSSNKPRASEVMPDFAGNQIGSIEHDGMSNVGHMEPKRMSRLESGQMNQTAAPSTAPRLSQEAPQMDPSRTRASIMNGVERSELMGLKEKKLDPAIKAKLGFKFGTKVAIEEHHYLFLHRDLLDDVQRIRSYFPRPREIWNEDPLTEEVTAADGKSLSHHGANYGANSGSGNTMNSNALRERRKVLEHSLVKHNTKLRHTILVCAAVIGQRTGAIRVFTDGKKSLGEAFEEYFIRHHHVSGNRKIEMTKFRKANLQQVARKIALARPRMPKDAGDKCLGQVSHETTGGLNYNDMKPSDILAHRPGLMAIAQHAEREFGADRMKLESELTVQSRCAYDLEQPTLTRSFPRAVMPDYSLLHWRLDARNRLVSEKLGQAVDALEKSHPPVSAFQNRSKAHRESTSSRIERLYADAFRVRGNRAKSLLNMQQQKLKAEQAFIDREARKNRKIKARMAKNGETIHTFEHRNRVWTRAIEQKRAILAEAKVGAELDEHCTFHPWFSETSRILEKRQRDNFEERQRKSYAKFIYRTQRHPDYQAIQEARELHACTFRPDMSKTERFNQQLLADRIAKSKVDHDAKDNHNVLRQVHTLPLELRELPYQRIVREAQERHSKWVSEKAEILRKEGTFQPEIRSRNFQFRNPHLAARASADMIDRLYYIDLMYKATRMRVEAVSDTEATSGPQVTKGTMSE